MLWEVFNGGLINSLRILNAVWEGSVAGNLSCFSVGVTRATVASHTAQGRRGLNARVRTVPEPGQNKVQENGE